MRRFLLAFGAAAMTTVPSASAKAELVVIDWVGRIWTSLYPQGRWTGHRPIGNSFAARYNALTADPASGLLVTMRSDQSLVWFRPDGTVVLERPVTPAPGESFTLYNYATGLAFLPGGDLLASQYQDPWLLRIDPATGFATRAHHLSVFSSVMDLTVAQDGHVYATTTREAWRFTLSTLGTHGPPEALPWMAAPDLSGFQGLTTLPDGVIVGVTNYGSIRFIDPIAGAVTASPWFGSAPWDLRGVAWVPAPAGAGAGLLAIFVWARRSRPAGMTEATYSHRAPARRS